MQTEESGCWSPSEFTFLEGLITSQIPGSAWCERLSEILEAEIELIRDRCKSLTMVSALKEMV